MLFPSEVFLFMFLPFVLAVYYLGLRKHTLGKNIFLFIMSLLFYGKRQVICWIENHFKKIDNYIEN